MTETISLSLVVKLCSALVHADEALNSRTPAPVDVSAFLALLADPEVEEFMTGLRARGLLPVKR